MKKKTYYPIIKCMFIIAIQIIAAFPIKMSFGGECLQTRQEMLDDYNNAISNLITDPNADYNLGTWIGNCWYHWDPRYPNGELNDELGKAILDTINNPNIKEDIKIKSLEIACNAAPGNLFNEMIRLLNEKEGEQRELAFRAILEIWKYNTNKDKEISEYNYIKLFKKILPEAFTPPFKDRNYMYNYGRGQRPVTQNDYWLCSYYAAMGNVYSFDYLKAKKILIENDLFYPSNCAFGKIFQDPRAFEDAKYLSYDYESNLFFSLLRHLELEFKTEWLQKIEPHQLSLLRNSIIATYGWNFKNRKLKNWINSYIHMMCRDGICGQVNNNFKDNLLTDIDKKNIALIKDLEQ